MSTRNIVVAQEPETSTQPLPPAAPAPDVPRDDGPPDEPEQDLKNLGRKALDSAEQSAPDVAEVPAPAPQAGAPAEADKEGDAQFDLGRVAWLVTVLSCLLAVVILALDGYAGYAAVTAAVALAAAINLV
jgi:hypothetical protein